MKVDEMTFLLGCYDVEEELTVTLGELHRQLEGFLIITYGEENSRFFVKNEEVLTHGGLLNATDALYQACTNADMKRRALLANNTIFEHMDNM